MSAEKIVFITGVSSDLAVRWRRKRWPQAIA